VCVREREREREGGREGGRELAQPFALYDKKIYLAF